MPRIVILGTAHPHIFPLAAHAKLTPGHEMIGVFDDDPTRLAESSAKMELKPLASLEAALAAKPDLALIGAVPSERAALAEAAVKAGAAVLADKPLALTGEALERLKATAEKSGKVMSVYYPYRGTPQVRLMRQYLQEGRIGKPARVFATGPHMLGAVVRPDWHWTRKGNGGILIDIGSHYLDICNWLLNEYPAQVSAADANIANHDHPEFQDIGHARLSYPSGALGYVDVDWLGTKTAGYDTQIWIQGTTGKIEFRAGNEQTLRWWTEQAAGESLDAGAFPSTADWTTQLIADLAAGKPGAVPQNEVWNASRLSLTAFESARLGKVFSC